MTIDLYLKLIKVLLISLQLFNYLTQRLFFEAVLAMLNICAVYLPKISYLLNQVLCNPVSITHQQVLLLVNTSLVRCLTSFRGLHHVKVALADCLQRFVSVGWLVCENMLSLIRLP